MYRSCRLGLLAGSVGLMSVTQAAGQQTCRPSLGFKEVRFSEMQPPTMERKWTAVLSVDPGAVHVEARSRGSIDRFLG
jgi:hypothetical protein